ncbi:hypothetical protein LAU_0041 [Lausannevirus]|uniref:Uncharacterized protein n=1 Tax=Lausannevirus TaxID=999883 RepID=F2WKX4_9VIRU|nr:hypothetical protein LAU_0041 [Lausannevirus]AEA06897.1 hypothetical protein LAU_0041 [Lausannevirus]
MHLYVTPMPIAGAVIGWEEGQKRENLKKHWYTIVPGILFRTLCWPFYIRTYF